MRRTRCAARQLRTARFAPEVCVTSTTSGLPRTLTLAPLEAASATRRLAATDTALPLDACTSTSSQRRSSASRFAPLEACTRIEWQVPLICRRLPEELRATSASLREISMSSELPEDALTVKLSPGVSPRTETREPDDADNSRKAGASTRTW